VHQGRPYADKPRLFLHKNDFERETDNAVYLQGHTIRSRQAGCEVGLTVADDRLIYEDEQLCVHLSPRLEILAMEARQPFEGTRSLRTGAEMALIWSGVTNSLSFLLDAHLNGK
jgi:hypothetical protein